MLNADRPPGSVVEVNTDITARERLQEDLERAHRNKDEFLATLGHELRNPLATVVNAVNLLKQAGTDEGLLHDVRDMIERQARHMTRLVDDILDVSRISQGKITLDRAPIELAPAIRRAVDAARPLIEGRQQDLSVSLPAEAIWLEADPIRVEQILVNLVSNATKYTGAGGRIWVMASRIDDEAVITVRDTGVGIEPEMLPRIFEMFAQQGRTLDRSEGGLGVGLTLVKRLAELHGGRVEAASPGVGRGSEFTVRLPISEPPTSPAGPDGSENVNESKKGFEIEN